MHTLLHTACTSPAHGGALGTQDAVKRTAGKIFKIYIMKDCSDVLIRKKIFTALTLLRRPPCYKPHKHGGMSVKSI
jgi:hypothetical protein